jgi:CHAD domain-containing protein
MLHGGLKLRVAHRHVLHMGFTSAFHLCSMQQALVDHAVTLTARLERSLAVVGDRPTEARIHALRVRIKKLRSLLRLLHVAAPGVDPPRKPMERLRAVFRAAGTERDIQVSRELVRSLRNVDRTTRKAYLERCERREKKAARALARQLSRLRRSDPAKLLRYVRAATAHNGDTLGRTMETYARRELLKARRLFETQHAEETLHEVRKHVKNAWHTLRIHGMVRTTPKRLAALAEAQERLGRWHDAHVLLLDLRRWRGGPLGERSLVPAAMLVLHERERAVLRALAALFHGSSAKMGRGGTTPPAR